MAGKLFFKISCRALFCNKLAQYVCFPDIIYHHCWSDGRSSGEGSTGFFVGGFSVHDYRITLRRNLLAAVPNFFYKWTSSVILSSWNSVCG